MLTLAETNLRLVNFFFDGFLCFRIGSFLWRTNMKRQVRRILDDVIVFLSVM